AAVIPQGITAFAERMGAHARVLWLDDITQFEFYDQPVPVTTAADAVAEHFRESFHEQQDVAAVTTVVEGVATLADLGRFDALASLYADEIMVDYSSLTGEPANTVTSADLMRSWAGFLPGFDLTRHSLSGIHVSIDGDSAVATAGFTADHFIGELFWQARGDYRYELRRDGRDWKIVGHTMNLRGEDGTRDALAIAPARAAERPGAVLVRDAAAGAVRAFLESLESKDMNAFANVWADNAVQEMPFAPEGFPKDVRGKNGILAHYQAWPAVSGDAEFTENLRFYPMQDPEWVFATFTGHVDIIPTGRLYEQTYGGLFHVVDGKIVLFREYFNPGFPHRSFHAGPYGVGMPAQIVRRSPFEGSIRPGRVPLFTLRSRPSLPFPHPWNYREPLRVLSTFYHGAEAEPDHGARHNRYLDMPGFAPVLVSRDPGVIEAISKSTGDKPGQFDRDTMPTSGIARATGDKTLLYANGATWRAQKQM
ncbi:Uncharacterized protein YesE, partial [Durusdinium trenchii]